MYVIILIIIVTYPDQIHTDSRLVQNSKFVMSTRDKTKAMSQLVSPRLVLSQKFRTRETRRNFPCHQAGIRSVRLSHFVSIKFKTRQSYVSRRDKVRHDETFSYRMRISDNLTNLYFIAPRIVLYITTLHMVILNCFMEPIGIISFKVRCFN